MIISLALQKKTLQIYLYPMAIVYRIDYDDLRNINMQIHVLERRTDTISNSIKTKKHSPCHPMVQWWLFHRKLGLTRVTRPGHRRFQGNDNSNQKNTLGHIKTINMSRTKTSLDILLEIQKRNPSSPRIHPSVSPLKRGRKAADPGPVGHGFCYSILLAHAPNLLGGSPRASDPSAGTAMCPLLELGDSTTTTIKR